MLVYRIVYKSYSRELRTSGLEGRWNSEGKRVIYAAGSIALAFLENMVRRQGVGFNSGFKTMIIEIPDELKIKTIRIESLAPGWRKISDYSKCQSLGNEWYDKAEKPVLKVPSAVLPEEFIYVMNSAHPDFKKIKLIKTTELIPDERIEDILKSHSVKGKVD
jgi:RES domain-containing protein